MCIYNGRFATLHEPRDGKWNIQIIERDGDGWLAQICDTDTPITVYEGDFELDD